MTTLLRLRPGVRRLRVNAGRSVHLAAWPHGTRVEDVTALQDEILERLAGGGQTRESLRAAAPPDNGSTRPGDATAFVELLDRQGWIARSVVDGDRPMYDVNPLRPHDDEVTRAPGGRWRLSRFAVLRPDGDALLLECPCASAEIRVYDAGLAAFLCRLAISGAGADEARGPDRLLLSDLRRTGFMAPADRPDGEETRLRHWQPHDLWFHARSRSGSRGRPRWNFGATYRGRSSFPQPAARRSDCPGATVGLFRPDLDALRTADAGLTSVVESRRSIRVHDDDRPLTVRQLGEFLFRCARARAVNQGPGEETVDLPYPTAGAVGELELYLAVRKVAGLAAGLYRYDRIGHRLERCPADRPAVEQIIRDAAASAGAGPPQAVVVITARFARVMWKYEGMAYALVLKHVGVLYELMYLVATAMRIAPCALGASNAELFSQAAGLDYFEESSVGEFLLGNPLPEHVAARRRSDGAATA